MFSINLCDRNSLHPSGSFFWNLGCVQTDSNKGKGEKGEKGEVGPSPGGTPFLELTAGVGTVVWVTCLTPISPS